jgi:hypothetical protein
MIVALLAGRKTQTRRVLKGNAPECPPLCYGTIPCGICGVDPRYAPGDRLWVRENWRVGAWNEDRAQIAVDYCDGPRTEWLTDPTDHDGDKFNKLWISSSDEPYDKGIEPDDDGNHRWKPGESPLRWRPSIHMPRWASRLTLIVEAVKVERLQAISREDAIAEGCDSPLVGTEPPPPGPGVYLADERTSFAILWNSINGPTAWATNPWVVAVSFRVVRGNIDKIIDQREVAA